MEVSGPLGPPGPTPVPTIESIQKFGKIVGGLPLALVLRVMSFIEYLSLNEVNGIRHKVTHDKQHFYPITSSQFLVLVRECLTKKEKAKLNELLAPFVIDPKRPADHEIERCFAAMGVDFKKACLEEIVKAIQDRTLSKQDVEITARVIEKELASNGINYKFTEFSEKKYEKELFDIINKDSFPIKDILSLDFSGEPIKVVPNILGAFKKLIKLDFNDCTRLTTPPDLKNNQLLTILSFRGCTSLTTPPELSGNQLLTELSFFDCKSLRTPPDLNNNQMLIVLNFHKCKSLTMLPDLSGNEELRHLYFFLLHKPHYSTRFKC